MPVATVSGGELAGTSTAVPDQLVVSLPGQRVTCSQWRWLPELCQQKAMMADSEQGAAAPMAAPPGKRVNCPPKMSPSTVACSVSSPAVVASQRGIHGEDRLLQTTAQTSCSLQLVWAGMELADSEHAALHRFPSHTVSSECSTVVLVHKCCQSQQLILCRARSAASDTYLAGCVPPVRLHAAALAAVHPWACPVAGGPSGSPGRRPLCSVVVPARTARLHVTQATQPHCVQVAGDWRPFCQV